MSRESDLLTALLDACRRELVTHEEAARLVGIHKADIGDLVAWRMVECAVWRCYQTAFLHTFPECDVRLHRSPERVEPPNPKPWPEPMAWRDCDPDNLAPSQPHLHDPLSDAAIEMAEPRIGIPWENKRRTFAPREPRALPRDTGQQLFAELDADALDADGDEFDFIEAA